MGDQTANLQIKIGSSGDFAALQAGRAQMDAMRASAETLRTVLSTLGASLGIAGLASLVEGTMSFGASITHLAAQAGISTQAFQVLGMVALDAGIKQDELGSKLDFLHKSMGLAAEGAGAQNKAIADLGLSTADLLAMPVERQLEAISKAYVNSADKGKAYADVVALLGRGTAQLMQVVQQLGTKGFDAAAAENAPWIISDPQLQRLEKADQTLDRIGQKIKILFAEAYSGNDQTNAFAIAVGLKKKPTAAETNPVSSAPGGTSDNPNDLDYPVQSAPDPAVKIQAQMAATLQALPAMQAAHAALTAALQAEAGSYETLDEKATRLRAEADADEAASKKMAGNPADFEAQVKAVDLLTAAAKLRTEANKDAAEADKQYIAETIQAANADYAEEKKLGELKVSNLEREEQAREKLVAVAMAAIEHDYTLTDNQKWEEKRALIEGNIAALQTYIDKQEAIANNPLNPTEVSQKAAGAAQTGSNTLAGQQGMVSDMGADATSFTQQFSAGLTKIQSQWGTLQQQIAGGMTGVIASAENSVSKGLDEWLMKTKSFGQSVKDIWVGFEQSAISAFSQMVAKYLMSKLTMFAIDEAVAAKGLLLSAASSAKSLIMWLPAAISASISSYGMAAAIGAAAVIAVVAAHGFEEGGYTGDGGSSEVAGVVHRGEYVMPASAVQYLGRDNLARMHEMAVNPTAGASTAGGGGGGVSHSFHFHQDMNEAVRAALKSPATHKHLVNISERTVRQMT